MGKLWREHNGIEHPATTGPEMRLMCQRPGKKDAEGKPVYFTEQGHKRECDVNEIIKKYDKQGLISHISEIEAKFGDVTGADFKLMNDKVANAMSMFEKLPAAIRKRFRNSPGLLLEFMENENNREEAIKLGLINKHWTPESDGLGEHVKLGENVHDNTNAGERQSAPVTE